MNSTSRTKSAWRAKGWSSPAKMRPRRFLISVAYLGIGIPHWFYGSSTGVGFLDVWVAWNVLGYVGLAGANGYHRNVDKGRSCGELSCVWNWQSGKPAVASWLLALENQSTCLGAVALSNAWWFMGSTNRQTIDMVQFPFSGWNPLAMFLTGQFQHNSAQAKTI